MVRNSKKHNEQIVSTASTESKESWKTAVEQLRGSLDRQTFMTLLGDAVLLDHANNCFVVGIRNAITRSWCEQRLSRSLENVLSGLYEEPQKVSFVLSDSYHPSSAPVAETVTAEEVTVVREPEATRRTVPFRRPTYERYSFDNFVVADSNNMAFAACRAVAELPASSYNPLFIYSGVGMGKTHLLHAIANHLRGSDLNVLYVTSEQFTNDFIDSIQHHNGTVFHEKYRNADVLLIDDIQFIIGKESTQEEFFHTFNALYEMNKQIVITSDRPPRQMTTLDERMRSRFEWGLTVDIQSPSLETRIAILNSKCHNTGKNVPEDVLEQIARQVNGSVRELEGALNRVLAVSDLCGRRMDRDLVRLSLTDMTPAHPKMQTSDLISVVSNVFGVPEEKIMSRDRSKAVALSRQVVMYLLREEGNISLPQIGQALGGRDHSTVIHGCEKVAGLMKSDNHFRRQVLSVKEKLFA